MTGVVERIERYTLGFDAQSMKAQRDAYAGQWLVVARENEALREENQRLRDENETLSELWR
jgi:hypothetical protein